MPTVDLEPKGRLYRILDVMEDTTRRNMKQLECPQFSLQGAQLGGRGIFCDSELLRHVLLYYLTVESLSIVLPFKKSWKRNLIINLEPGFGSFILTPAIDIPLKALAAFIANEKNKFF